MAGMILNVNLTRNGYAELEGRKIKYWAGEGLPTFEGELNEFASAYPAVMEELLDCGAVRRLNGPRELWDNKPKEQL